MYFFPFQFLFTLFYFFPPIEISWRWSFAEALALFKCLITRVRVDRTLLFIWRLAGFRIFISTRATDRYAHIRFPAALSSRERRRARNAADWPQLSSSRTVCSDSCGTCRWDRQSPWDETRDPPDDSQWVTFRARKMRRARARLSSPPRPRRPSPPSLLISATCRVHVINLKIRLWHIYIWYIKLGKKGRRLADGTATLRNDVWTTWRAIEWPTRISLCRNEATGALFSGTPGSLLSRRRDPIKRILTTTAQWTVDFCGGHMSPDASDVHSCCSSVLLFARGPAVRPNFRFRVCRGACVTRPACCPLR